MVNRYFNLATQETMAVRSGPLGSSAEDRLALPPVGPNLFFPVVHEAPRKLPFTLKKEGIPLGELLITGGTGRCCARWLCHGPCGAVHSGCCRGA